jgi:iron complex transport system ATP-binding protein
MKNIALCADFVSANIGNVQILQSISAQFKAGCWTSVVGPNGAGKSTLLKALCGLLPYEGTVQLGGRALAEWPPRERAKHLAWLGQGEGGADDLSVYDVVMLGRLPHQAWLGGANPADHEAVLWAMHCCEVQEWPTRRLSELSAGERQRVLLARALAVKAQLLVMDEPLANLDLPHQAQWVRVVRGLVAQGITVVSVLHELQVALMADEMLILAKGRTLHHGACEAQATHEALAQAFDSRLKVKSIDGQAVLWMAVPETQTEQKVFDAS